MIGKISKIEAEGDLLVIEAGIKAGIILIDHQKEILEIDLRDALTVEKKGILLKIVQNVFLLIIQPKSQDNLIEKEEDLKDVPMERIEAMIEETETKEEDMIKILEEIKEAEGMIGITTEEIVMTEDQEIKIEIIVATEEIETKEIEEEIMVPEKTMTVVTDTIKIEEEVMIKEEREVVQEVAVEVVTIRKDINLEVHQTVVKADDLFTQIHLKILIVNIQSMIFPSLITA